MEEFKNKYYISINEENRIVKTFSSAFGNPIDSDIEVGEGVGSQFRVSGELLSEELKFFADIENGLQILDENGLYCLKYENGLIHKVDENELQEELNNLPKQQPTKIEMLEEENIMLMETVTQLYEINLEQDSLLEGLRQDNLEMMLALTEIYENVM